MSNSRVYASTGNKPLIDLLNPSLHRVLDIGCGAGGNAAAIKICFPNSEISGITYSTVEASLASKLMKNCWVADIENEIPLELRGEKFDTLFFSHVLEHLRYPAAVLSRFEKLLSSNGQVLIAVPNVLSWRMRVKFLLGNFQYQNGGVLDDTHLRFFTFFTADKFLFSETTDLEIVCKTVSGAVPLWILRRYILPRNWCKLIDEWGCRHWPNLFGEQILIRAIRRASEA